MSKFTSDRFSAVWERHDSLDWGEGSDGAVVTEALRIAAAVVRPGVIEAALSAHRSHNDTLETEADIAAAAAIRAALTGGDNG